MVESCWLDLQQVMPSDWAGRVRGDQGAGRQAQAAGGLVRALAAQWPAFASYVINWVTVGITWINHDAMFQYLRRVS